MTEPFTLLHHISGLDPATTARQLLTPFTALGGAVFTCRSAFLTARLAMILHTAAQAAKAPVEVLKPSTSSCRPAWWSPTWW